MAIVNNSVKSISGNFATVSTANTVGVTVCTENYSTALPMVHSRFTCLQFDDNFANLFIKYN